MTSALFTVRPLVALVGLLACSIVFSGHTLLNRAGGKPDLFIPTQVGINQISDTAFSYGFTIKNGGTLFANMQNMMVTTQLKIGDGTYQTIQTNRFPDMTSNPTRLDPGESTNVTMTVKNIVNLPPAGEALFYVRVVLDVTNVVKESRENNNSREGNSAGIN